MRRNRPDRTIKACAKDVQRRIRIALEKLEPDSKREKRIRREIVARYLQRDQHLADIWVNQRTERDNFYYELTSKNRHDLASQISTLLGLSPAEVFNYLEELRTNVELSRHVRDAWSVNSSRADSVVGYGRREGWYGFIRALKPKVVVETGVHDGLGALVILSALKKNLEEGYPGKYIGTDINPSAGWLITSSFKKMSSVLYGDSLESITRLEDSVDVFINDSDHSAEYESAEYEAIAPLLNATSLILGDNSHSTDSLREFAEKTGRPYVFFREQPHNHWYPGAGIGISPARAPLTFRG